MDAVSLALGCAGFLLILAAAAWLGDDLDRRDARRRAEEPRVWRARR